MTKIMKKKLIQTILLFSLFICLIGYLFYKNNHLNKSFQLKMALIQWMSQQNIQDYHSNHFVNLLPEIKQRLTTNNININNYQLINNTDETFNLNFKNISFQSLMQTIDFQQSYFAMQSFVVQSTEAGKVSGSIKWKLTI